VFSILQTIHRCTPYAGFGFEEPGDFRLGRRIGCVGIFWVVAVGFGLFVSDGAVIAADDATAETAHADPAHGEHHEVHIGTKGADTSPEEFKSDLAIFTFVVFLLLLGILWKFAWGPIAAGLEKREAGIRKAIDDANAAREAAEEMRSEHAGHLQAVQEEIREILAEARRDAEHTKQEIISEAQKEAEAARNRATDDIGRARDAAIKELFDGAAQLVADAAEHVLSRSLTGDDQSRLIDEALSKFSRN